MELRVRDAKCKDILDFFYLADDRQVPTCAFLGMMKLLETGALDNLVCTDTLRFSRPSENSRKKGS